MDSERMQRGKRRTRSDQTAPLEGAEMATIDTTLSSVGTAPVGIAPAGIASIKTASAEHADLLAKFADYLYTHCSVANGTVELQVGYIRRMLPVIGPTPGHTQMEHFIADMRRRDCSSAHVINAQRSLENYSEFISNPISFTRPKKSDKASVATLSEARIAVMISNAKNLREKTMLGIMATTGIRNSELVNLRVRDVNIGQQLLCVEVGKGAKGRLIFLTPPAMELLGQYLRDRDGAPDDWLFVTLRHGHQLQTQDIRKLVRVVAKRAGIPGRIWPHLLRHSLATAMLDRGANLYAIQALLGHAQLSTTLEYYLHPSRKSVQADCLKYAPSLL